MMAKTYTEYKLTEAQLKRLSQVVNHREPNYGTAMQALIRKNLVYENEQGKIQANGNGVMALDQARKEGW